MPASTFPTFLAVAVFNPNSDSRLSTRFVALLRRWSTAFIRNTKKLHRDESRCGDPDDWPIVAVAMLLDLPIWTEDQDFFGSGIATWTTDRVELYLTLNREIHHSRTTAKTQTPTHSCTGDRKIVSDAMPAQFRMSFWSCAVK